jgi:hypothetical protein
MKKRQRNAHRGAASDSLAHLSHRELQAEAKRLGVSAAGSSEAIRERIRASNAS